MVVVSVTLYLYSHVDVYHICFAVGVFPRCQNFTKSVYPECRVDLHKDVLLSGQIT